MRARAQARGGCRYFWDMDVELTPAQARAIARLRWRHPGADVCTHLLSWGVIVEARRDGRVTEVLALDAGGGIRGEQRLGVAA